MANNSSQHILVTGGAGYIGSLVVEKLLEENHTVDVYDTFIYGKAMFHGIQQKKNLRLIKGDILDKKKLMKVVKDYDAIVHLAGIVGDLACSIDEAHSYQVNVIGTKNLCDVAKENKIKKFIFASSCSVYGKTEYIAHETSPVFPLALYARTKLESESDLLQDPSPNLHPTILRFTTVFGHSRKQRFDLVANLFTAQAYFHGKVTVKGGDQWRPFIHVKDIARAISTVLKSPRAKIERQIFNVGDDTQHLKIIDLAHIIKKVAKDKEVSIETASIGSDKRDYRVSFKKIREQLGFTASISVEEGLWEIYENLKNNNYNDFRINVPHELHIPTKTGRKTIEKLSNKIVKDN
jgi:nucleoside-diphosphate-sugar epimerase